MKVWRLKFVITTFLPILFSGLTQAVIVKDFGGDNDNVNAIAVTSEGKIVATGQGNGSYVLMQFDQNGQVDSHFGHQGRWVGGAGCGRDVKVGGSFIWTVGDRDGHAFMGRFHLNGTLDRELNTAVVQTQPYRLVMSQSQPPGPQYVVAEGFSEPSIYGVSANGNQLTPVQPSGETQLFQWQPTHAVYDNDLLFVSGVKTERINSNTTVNRGVVVEYRPQNRNFRTLYRDDRSIHGFEKLGDRFLAVGEKVIALFLGQSTEVVKEWPHSDTLTGIRHNGERMLAGGYTRNGVMVLADLSSLPTDNPPEGFQSIEYNLTTPVTINGLELYNSDSETLLYGQDQPGDWLVAKLDASQQYDNGFGNTNVTVTPTPSNTTQSPTMAPTPSTEPPTGNCPAPVGVPDFQVFDPNTNRLYVVAHQPQTHQLLLIRYTADGSLDDAFGSCGVYTYYATGLSSSFTVTSGVYREEDSQRFIYLSAWNNGKVTLVRLNIDQAASQMAYNTADGNLGFEARIHAMASQDTHVYFTGVSAANVLLGEGVTLVPTSIRTDGQPGVLEAGHALMVDRDGDYLYVTGRQDNDLLIRKYTRATRNPVSGFGVSGVVTDTFAGASRGQALALHDRALYVLGNVEQEDGDLFIRRYDLNGQRDDSFTEVIKDTGIAGLDAVVEVVATNNVLSVFKYDPGDNQVAVRVFDWQGQEVGQHLLLSSVFSEGIAAHGLALNPRTGRVYFAGRGSSGTLAVESLDIPQWVTGEPTPSTLLPASTRPMTIPGATTEATMAETTTENSNPDQELNAADIINWPLVGESPLRHRPNRGCVISNNGLSAQSSMEPVPKTRC